MYKSGGTDEKRWYEERQRTDVVRTMKETFQERGRKRTE